VQLFEGGDYAFASRGEVNLHLATVERVQPDESTVAVFLYVSDAMPCTTSGGRLSSTVVSSRRSTPTVGSSRGRTSTAATARTAAPADERAYTSAAKAQRSAAKASNRSTSASTPTTPGPACPWRHRPGRNGRSRSASEQVGGRQPARRSSPHPGGPAVTRDPLAAQPPRPLRQPFTSCPSPREKAQPHPPAASPHRRVASHRSVPQPGAGSRVRAGLAVLGAWCSVLGARRGAGLRAGLDRQARPRPPDRRTNPGLSVVPGPGHRLGVPVGFDL